MWASVGLGLGMRLSLRPLLVGSTLCATLRIKSNSILMLGALAISGYVLPPPVLTAERGARRGIPSGDSLARLAELAETQARARAKLKEQRDRFEQLYRHAEQPEVDPDDLVALAQALRTQELENAAILLPQIEQLRINLASPKARVDTPAIRSWRRLAEESLEIAVVWLELY